MRQRPPSPTAGRHAPPHGRSFMPTTSSSRESARATWARSRSDSSKQTTFRGWPLYFFVGDAKAGDVKGEGVGDVWFVLRDQPYSIALMSNAPGPEPEPYLSDGTGRSLYPILPGHDRNGEQRSRQRLHRPLPRQ